MEGPWTIQTETGRVTYHRQYSRCSKSSCRQCSQGPGHGPYWYVYKEDERGRRTRRTYLGKNTPDEVKPLLLEESQAPSIPSVRLFVLGQVRLERGGELVRDARLTHKGVQMTLGSLLSSQGRQIVREQLSEILWPNQEQVATAQLDRIVYDLRSIFEPDRARYSASKLVLTPRPMIALAKQESLWVDADAFEEAASAAHKCQDLGLRERLVEQALSWYAGSYFEALGDEVEVVCGRREALHSLWIGLLLQASDLCIRRNDLESALLPLRKLLSVDPTNEAAAMLTMKVVEQLGNRSLALSIYQELTQALKQRHHLLPLASIQRLAVHIKRGPPAQGGAPQFLPFGRKPHGPLVGRVREMEQLQARLARVQRREELRLPGQEVPFDSLPQTILLCGQIGIGKTRLAEEVGRLALKERFLIAWGRAYIGSEHAYQIWMTALRRVVEQNIWLREAVSRRPRVFAPLVSFLPELELAVENREPQEQLRFWDAIYELLVLLASRQAMLILLDDLQWADSSSCELLAYLGRRIVGKPILLMATCRDKEFDRMPSLLPLLREQVLETVALQELADEQVMTLISHVLASQSTPLVEDICTRAAGNPFFAEELALSVVERAEKNHTQPPALDAPIVLPDTIAAVLDLRLSRLSTGCARLLSRAAILGGSFTFHTIAALEESLDEETLFSLLEEALHAGMLTEEGAGAHITYQFWHPLLESHLYEKHSAARRASLHRRAALLFEQEFRGHEEDGAATITHHLLRAGAAPSAIAHFAELAGNHAYTLSSYPDAAKYYRMVLEHLAEEDEHLEHIASLCELLGECTYIQGNKPEARRFYTRALEIHKRTTPDSPDRAEKAQLQALLLCEIGTIWRDTGKYREARECYQQGEQILREACILESSAWARIRYEQGFVLAVEGHFEDARRMASEALSLFERLVHCG